MDSKVKYIKKREENKKSTLHLYFSDTLLDDILTWKEERNRLIHALLKQQFEHNEIRDLAEQGNELANELRNRSGRFNQKIKKEQNDN